MRQNRLLRSRLRMPLLAAALAAAGLGQAQAAEMARVISSTPVIVSVPVTTPSCSQGEQIVQTAPTGAGAVIGAVAGGILGNAIGGGAGRALATGAGIVAGSVIGNNVEAVNTPATAVPVQRCTNVTRYQNRTVGYDVMYEYAGQRYSTRMARDPGREFAVSVQPAEGSLPAPADLAASNQPVPAYDAPVPSGTSYAPAPAPVYYYDYGPGYAPYYYAPAPVYVAPVIGLGFGFGWHGGRRWR